MDCMAIESLWKLLALRATIPSTACRPTFMIFIPFCGLPAQKNATIFYKIVYYKISLIKIVNKGSKRLS
jgi:hypothetical protein